MNIHFLKWQVVRFFGLRLCRRLWLWLSDLLRLWLNNLRRLLNRAKAILADPQTSGGLLIAVSPEYAGEISKLLQAHYLFREPIGVITPQMAYAVNVGN